jgi:hypothetical protein
MWSSVDIVENWRFLRNVGSQKIYKSHIPQILRFSDFRQKKKGYNNWLLFNSHDWSN